MVKNSLLEEESNEAQVETDENVALNIDNNLVRSYGSFNQE